MRANNGGNDEMDTLQALVIDNGPGTIKIGFAGARTPRDNVPTIIGRTKYQNDLVHPAPENQVYVCGEARDL